MVAMHESVVKLRLHSRCAFKSPVVGKSEATAGNGGLLH
jgi:hypothetical protein